MERILALMAGVAFAVLGGCFWLRPGEQVND
jgi:heme A synthase